MYWLDEDRVTVMPAKSMKDPVVGETREIAVRKESYKGKIQAMGKFQQLDV